MTKLVFPTDRNKSSIWTVELILSDNGLTFLSDVADALPVEIVKREGHELVINGISICLA